MSITTHVAIGFAVLLAAAEVTAAAPKSQQQVYAECRAQNSGTDPSLGSSKVELQIEACVQAKLQVNKQTGPIQAPTSTKPK
jgi:hypothetical protein